MGNLGSKVNIILVLDGGFKKSGSIALSVRLFSSNLPVLIDQIANCEECEE